MEYRGIIIRDGGSIIFRIFLLKLNSFPLDQINIDIKYTLMLFAEGNKYTLRTSVT